MRMRKISDPSYSDDKVMSIIVNRLNRPLFWAIYIFIYIISNFTRLLYFCVIEYQQSVKNQFPAKLIKFIRPTFHHIKKVFACFTILWQCWRDYLCNRYPKGQWLWWFRQRCGSRFVFPVGALTSNMRRRRHSFAWVKSKMVTPRWRHQIWHCRWQDNQTYLHSL